MIKSSLRKDNLSLNQQIIINGTIEKGPELTVHSIEYFPLWHLKALGSLLAFFFILVILIKEIRFTREGFKIQRFDQSQ